jgi:signal transduction histidine kinase
MGLLKPTSSSQICDTFVDSRAKTVIWRQMFVNLSTDAVSFCEEAAAICVRVRRRDNRTLVAIEVTGPGTPD